MQQPLPGEALFVPMSEPHLRHLLPWRELFESFRRGDGSEIMLPSGACGRIHARSAKVRHQVLQRHYLTEEMCCTDESCETSCEKTFHRPCGKGKKEVIVLGQQTSYGVPDGGLRLKDPIAAAESCIRFCNAFNQAVLDFATTEAKKYPASRIWATPQVPEEYLEETLRNFNPGYKPEHELFWALLSETNRYHHATRHTRQETTAGSDAVDEEEPGEPDDVLLLLCLAEQGRVNVRQALGCTYGGQAVGNGTHFLRRYILSFYLWCNAIVSCGWQYDSSKWGDLGLSSYLRRDLSDDCDFFTFIPSWRQFIAPEVLFLDLERTKEVLKRCFRFIYLLHLMEAYGADVTFDFAETAVLKPLDLAEIFHLPRSVKERLDSAG